MKFRATIYHYNDNKELGLCRATDKLTVYVELSTYLCMLMRMATEFAYDSGVPLDEINKAIQLASKSLANTEMKVENENDS
jgi:hypothetical protein